MLPAQTDIYTDFQGLARLRTQSQQKNPEVTRQVAQQFESIFTQMMLKSMRKASLGEGIFDSRQSQFYRDMYDQQLSVHLSSGTGLGLADMIVQQLGGTTEDGRKIVGKSLEDYRGSKVYHIYREVKQLSDETKELAVSEMVAPFKNTAGTESISGKENFIKTLRPHAEAAGARLGIDPGLLLAQAALETGWGKSVIKESDGSSSHNLFGIKADQRWDGGAVTTGTLEYREGVAVREKASFRAYESYTESFEDYVRFLAEQPRYKTALAHSAEPEKFAAALQQAGYATDPHYAEKIVAIYKREELAELR